MEFSCPHSDSEGGHAYRKLHERLSTLFEGLSFRQIAELTEHNQETVRRYMRGQDPSVAFLVAVCERTDVLPEWLLMGRGPQKNVDAITLTLQDIPTETLAAELAERLQKPQRNVRATLRQIESDPGAIRQSKRPSNGNDYWRSSTAQTAAGG